MVETLYQTQNPLRGMAECYELILKKKDTGGFIFSERHGWWDDPTKEFRLQRTTIEPEEGMSYDEALDMYKAARKYHARGGFVHAYSPDYYGDNEHEYQVIDPEE